MFVYLLQSSGSLILLYMLYYFMLSDLPYLRHNRAYLLGALIVSLIIPVLAEQLVLPASVTPPVNWIPAQENWADFEFDGTQNTSGITSILTLVVKLLYFTGVIIVLTRLIKGLNRIYQYHQNGIKNQINGQQVVTTDAFHLPFSFLQSVYISRHIPMKEHIKTILEHERVHICQWHSLDILFTELVHAIFWFNPVILFYKRSLQEVHEYLADAYVCQKTNFSEYAALLSAHSHMSNMESALAHQFFHSQIKNRIMKMQKTPANKRAVWKFSFSLPLIILILYAFASPENHLSHKNQAIHPDTIPPTNIIVKNKLPSNVKSYQIDNDRITIFINDGSSEQFNLSDKKEKQAFSERYGAVLSVTAPPPPQKPGIPDVLPPPPPPPPVPAVPSPLSVPDPQIHKAPTPPHPPAPPAVED